MLFLQPDICQRLRESIHRQWPEKKVKFTCKPKSWSTSRFMQISTPLKDWNLYYCYYEGYVSLRLERQVVNNHKDLIDHLRKYRDLEKKIAWHEYNGMKQGLCSVDTELSEESEVLNAFALIFGFFDPLIKGFIEKNVDKYPPQEEAPKYNESYSFSATNDDIELQTHIIPVGQLDYEHYVIPPYQRPYKWTAKNVNQLISDLVEFKNQSTYRLGTLVLNGNDIVDGQQRLITLSLLLSHLIERYGSEKRFEHYQNFFNGLKTFCDKTHFPNPYSLHNVVENMNTIITREHDMSEDTLDFILRRCEFVKVQLRNISEAFQFFDSQNARGKDLAAHDLLKAFHLREMDDMTAKDSENVDKWQHQKTDDLVELFLCLYRAKCWSLGKSARFFTKDDTTAFKGVSLSEGKRYPFYRLEIIAHVYTTYYMASPDRIVDSNQMEYPFNLDDQIINGSRFFDMIRYYSNLYKTIKEVETYKSYPEAEKIIMLIKSYNGCERTGDKYVASMFYTLLLYYVDRFGYEEMDKVVTKIFVWAYSLRLSNQAVQLVMMDNYAKGNGVQSMFRVIHDARTPFDIINISQPCLEKKECTKCDEIGNAFVELKKLQNL